LSLTKAKQKKLKNPQAVVADQETPGTEVQVVLGALEILTGIKESHYLPTKNTTLLEELLRNP
jgi:hypothetical protein